MSPERLKVERKVVWVLIACCLLVLAILTISVSVVMGLQNDLSASRADLVEFRSDLVASIENQQRRCRVANVTVRPKLHLPQVNCKETYPLPQERKAP